jgi:hypothetical protein
MIGSKIGRPQASSSTYDCHGNAAGSIVPVDLGTVASSAAEAPNAVSVCFDR